MRRLTVTVTTDGSGDATAYSLRCSGELHSITYDEAASGGFTDGVDFVITSEATGQTLWSQLNVNADVTVLPRVPTHTNAGVAALYAAAGEAVLARAALGSDRIKIVVSSGGASKTGTFHFLVG